MHEVIVLLPGEGHSTMEMVVDDTDDLCFFILTF